MCSFRLICFGIRASDWWNEQKCLFTFRNFRRCGYSLGGLKNSRCTENWALPGCYLASSDNSLPSVKTRQMDITHVIAKIFNNVSTSLCEMVTFLAEIIVDDILTGQHQLRLFSMLRPYLRSTKPPTQWLPRYFSGGISTTAWPWPITCIYYRW